MVSVTSVVNDLKEVLDRVTRSPARGRLRQGYGEPRRRARSPDERAFGEGTERDTRGAYAPRSENSLPSYRDAIRDSRIATYFVEECLEPATIPTATRTGKLTSTEANVPQAA